MKLLKKYPSLLNWLKPKLSIEILKCLSLENKQSELLIGSVLKTFAKKEVLNLLNSVEMALEGGYRIICPLNPSYPYSLSYNFLYPTPLLVKGVLYPNKKTISVVGSRNCSQLSKKWMSTEFKKFIKSKDNLVIASGGAYGIDQFAHSLSIQSEIPTYCILPTGINNIYPSNLIPLCEQIIETKGAVVSPFPPDFPVYKSNFHFRNRILVLLSDYVFVVEARRRSGSMMTASLSSEYGVPLVTLPQPPVNEFMGNLDLIERGVPFVCSSKDLESWMKSELSN